MYLKDDPLYGQFAYFGDLRSRLAELAGMAMPEEWTSHETPDDRYGILRNYLSYTYRRLVNEGNKIAFGPENRAACFNTGLMTPNYEYIYAFLVRNKRPEQPYFLASFCKPSSSNLQNNFDPLPEPANYFDDLSLLVFNPTFEIIPNIEHIVNDREFRFPENLQGQPDLLRIALEGAIRETKKRLRSNYKLAVPHCYNNRIQLLIPLYLGNSQGVPDVALALDRIGPNKYIARSCLTMKMAYQNARLIVKPESSWLRP